MEAVNPRVNATIWVDRLGAERAARAADASRDTNEWCGPLHGVPLAHKDMYYQAGKPLHCGSRLRKDFVPDYTATVIERLSDRRRVYRLAGLNMAEFAQNPTGHNREFGDCHNPWNPPYITGGSSSGSGAAVAARFVYAALGSDTGGSIRLPASACGVTGLKPTQTRVSRYGAMPLSFTLDNVGPLTRTARDCARVMSLIAGRDPRDPTSAHLPVPDYEGALDGDVRGMRIGIPTNYFFDNADPDGDGGDRAGGRGPGRARCNGNAPDAAGDGRGVRLRQHHLARRGGNDPRGVDAASVSGLCATSERADVSRLCHSRTVL